MLHQFWHQHLFTNIFENTKKLERSVVTVRSTRQRAGRGSAGPAAVELKSSSGKAPRRRQPCELPPEAQPASHGVPRSTRGAALGRVGGRRGARSGRPAMAGDARGEAGGRRRLQGSSREEEEGGATVHVVGLLLNFIVRLIPNFRKIYRISGHSARPN
jgi:hypothetical protein